MNLPEESIATWDELCEQFVANFSATYERPRTKNDLRAVVQRPKETLCKFIQRFSHVRNKIPRITDAEIISAFSAGVTDVRMHEKLIMRYNLASAVELFEQADKCAKAEEGRLFAHNIPDADADAKLTKAKSASKRKPAVVLTAEPEQKYRHKGESSAQGKHGERPFWVFHNMNSHNTEDCFELKKLSEENQKKCWSEEGANGNNGRFGNCGGGRGGNGGRHNNYNPRHAQKQ
jgi:hypothetical protein